MLVKNISDGLGGAVARKITRFESNSIQNHSKSHLSPSQSSQGWIWPKSGFPSFFNDFSRRDSVAAQPSKHPFSAAFYRYKKLLELFFKNFFIFLRKNTRGQPKSHTPARSVIQEPRLGKSDSEPFSTISHAGLRWSHSPNDTCFPQLLIGIKKCWKQIFLFFSYFFKKSAQSRSDFGKSRSGPKSPKCSKFRNFRFFQQFLTRGCRGGSAK